MPMGRGRTRVISDITIDEDLDFSGDYQITNLAAPASDEALRKGEKDIGNDEIADAAAIVRSKLNFGDGLVNADIAAAAAIVLSKIVNTYLLPTIMTARGDLVYRGSSYPGRIPKGTAGYALIMGANDPAWQAIPSQVTIVRKTADQTVNNSITLVSDTHLLLALGANEVWQIELTILCVGAADADIKFGLAFPTDCLAKWGLIGAGEAVLSQSWGYGGTNTTPALWTQTGTTALGINTPSTTGFRLSLIIINGANAGNLVIQWAQNTAQSSDTKVLENSCLIAHQLA